MGGCFAGNPHCSGPYLPCVGSARASILNQPASFAASNMRAFRELLGSEYLARTARACGVRVMESIHTGPHYCGIVSLCRFRQLCDDFRCKYLRVLPVNRPLRGLEFAGDSQAFVVVATVSTQTH